MGLHAARSQVGGDAGTPLHAAASSGDEARVRELLASSAAEVDARDDEGCSPLHWWAGGKLFLKLGRVLLAAGRSGIRSDGQHGSTSSAIPWIKCLARPAMLPAGLPTRVTCRWGRAGLVCAASMPTWWLGRGRASIIVQCVGLCQQGGNITAVANLRCTAAGRPGALETRSRPQRPGPGWAHAAPLRCPRRAERGAGGERGSAVSVAHGQLQPAQLAPCAVCSSRQLAMQHPERNFPAELVRLASAATGTAAQVAEVLLQNGADAGARSAEGEAARDIAPPSWAFLSQ